MEDGSNHGDGSPPVDAHESTSIEALVVPTSFLTANYDVEQLLSSSVTLQLDATLFPSEVVEQVRQAYSSADQHQHMLSIRAELHVDRWPPEDTREACFHLIGIPPSVMGYIREWEASPQLPLVRTNFR
jgi:hypothetical protein